MSHGKADKTRSTAGTCRDTLPPSPDDAESTRTTPRRRAPPEAVGGGEHRVIYLTRRPHDVNDEGKEEEDG